MAVASLVVALLLRSEARAVDVTERVSFDDDGTELAGGIESAVLSRDGRFMVYRGTATDSCPTFRVHDLRTQRITCQPGALPDGFGPLASVRAASFSGRFVALSVWQGASADAALFVWDRDTGDVERIDVLPDDEPSVRPGEPAISADGRFVAFSALRPGSPPGCNSLDPCRDVFLRDRTRATTERISVALGGGDSYGSSSAPSLSDDGSLVAFLSNAGDLVARVERNCLHSIVVYCTSDVYLRDRAKGTTTKVVTIDGKQRRNDDARGMVDRTGRHVDYVVRRRVLDHDASLARRYDVRTRASRLLLRAPDAEVQLPLSDDGTVVVVGAAYPGEPFPFLGVVVQNQVFGLFVHDRRTRSTRQVDAAADGGIPSTGRRNRYGVPLSPAIGLAGVSASGSEVAFTSDARNLVPGDTNQSSDAFVRRLDRRSGR